MLSSPPRDATTTMSCPLGGRGEHHRPGLTRLAAGGRELEHRHVRRFPPNLPPRDLEQGAVDVPFIVFNIRSLGMAREPRPGVAADSGVGDEATRRSWSSTASQARPSANVGASDGISPDVTASRTTSAKRRIGSRWRVAVRRRSGRSIDAARAVGARGSEMRVFPDHLGDRFGTEHA